MTPYAKPRFITDPEIIRKILDRCKMRIILMHWQRGIHSTYI